MMRKRVRSPPRDNTRYNHDSRYRLARYNHDLDANEYRGSSSSSRRVDERINSSNSSYRQTNALEYGGNSERNYYPKTDLDGMMIHGLGEAERINTSNSSSYGRTNVSERDYLGPMLEKIPIYPKTDLDMYTLNKRSYKDTANYSLLNKNDQLRLDGEKLYGGDRDQSYSRQGQVPNFYSKDYSRKEDDRRPYSIEDKTQLYSGEEKPRSYYSRKEDKPQLYSGEEHPRSYSTDEKPYFHYRERESQLCFKNTHNDEKPSTQYKLSTVDPFRSSVDDLSRSYKNDFLVGSDGYNRQHLIDSLPTENVKPFLEDGKNHMKDKFSPNIDYGYSTGWRSNYSEMVPLPDKPYGKLSDVKDDYRHIDPLGSRIKDLVLNECSSHREDPSETRLWDDRRCSPVGRLVSNYSDAPRSLYTAGINVQALGRREIDLVYEGENYRSSKITSSGEHYGYRQGKGLQPREERTKSYLREEVYRPHENRSSREDYGYGQDESLQPRNGRRISYSREDYDYGRPNQYMAKDCDNVYDRVDQICDGGFNNPLERVKVEDVPMHRRSNDVSTRRRDISERLNIGRKLSTTAHNNRANKLPLGGFRYQNPWVSNEKFFSGKSNPYTFGGRLTGKARSSNPGVRDIKKRLGPSWPVKHIALKNQRNRKVVTKSEDGEGSVQAEEEGLLDNGVETTKFEPPGNSDEFKQMVRSAFFKFVKQLNENLVEVRKFQEQGKAGSLKCWVCGSSSEDFSDTESLVKHACTELRVGYRAQHLGFQKALCALMGWKAAETHDNEWVREVLSVAEISSQNEDLILWPPLVVVHNSSLIKSNPAGQVAVSVEGLQNMIQVMGFGEKAKVCPGKPENQSIMVIKFSATYSGFLEAERLHKFFADNKHGRTQFQKTGSEGCIDCDGKTNISSTRNMRDELYGFLGICSDLNKLDSETKKRCVVRRKKEIQDLGDDAPLKAE